MTAEGGMDIENAVGSSTVCVQASRNSGRLKQLSAVWQATEDRLGWVCVAESV